MHFAVERNAEDLREFIQRVEGIGEYKLIEGADWNGVRSTRGKNLLMLPLCS